MTVHLDHGVEGEEYEEVLAFSVRESALTRWIMWRDVELMFVQPLIGRLQAHSSAAEAIAALSPGQEVELTDIEATHWPA
jgi:hypothetical protein